MSAGAPILDHAGELTACINPKHLVSIDLAYLRNNVLTPWSGVSYAASRGKNDGVGEADGGNLMRQTPFPSGSNWILWASTLNEDQN